MSQVRSEINLFPFTRDKVHKKDVISQHYTVMQIASEMFGEMVSLRATEVDLHCFHFWDCIIMS